MAGPNPSEPALNVVVDAQIQDLFAGYEAQGGSGTSGSGSSVSGLFNIEDLATSLPNILAAGTPSDLSPYDTVSCDG